MRWFKHLSLASEDEKLSEILDRHGAEGYGVYWLILERIAFLMDKSDSTEARYSIKKWSKFCGKSPKVFRKFLESFQELSLFSSKICEKNSEFLIIDCPNLLKYRDEYSKKSGQPPDNIQTDSGQTPDQDTDTDTDTDTDKKKTAAPDLLSFKIKDSLISWAESKDIDKPELEEYVEECLVWHGSKGTKYTDWNRTIQNWIIKDLKRNPRSANDYL